jgi:TPR repeat protein
MSMNTRQHSASAARTSAEHGQFCHIVMFSGSRPILLLAAMLLLPGLCYAARSAKPDSVRVSSAASAASGVAPAANPDASANADIAGIRTAAHAADADHDYLTAFGLWESLALQGDPEAEAKLGERYRHSPGREPDIEKSMYWLRRAADQGWAAAQLSIGLRYLTGPDLRFPGNPQASDILGTDPDPANPATPRPDARNLPQAAYWFEKLAAQGDARGRYNLGLLYLEGLGVVADHGRGVALVRQAAEQNLPQAQMTLFQIYSDGQYSVRNLHEADHWLEQAVLGNFGPARLARCEQSGNPGIGAEDLARAVAACHTLADGGSSVAMRRLGLIYAQGGPSLPPDLTQALHWLTLAAEKWDSEALIKLGEGYAGDPQGLPGLTVNLPLAWTYLRVAYWLHAPGAPELLKGLGARLSAREWHDTARFMREFSIAHPPPSGGWLNIDIPTRFTPVFY